MNVDTKQKCRRCNGDLVRDEQRNCLICPICYPPNRTSPVIEKEESKYLDVQMTEARVRKILAEQVEVGEERIREIVRDELENWHIHKPPVTKTDIDEMSDVDKAAMESATDHDEALATLTPFAAARKSNPDYDPLIDAPPKAMLQETKINWRVQAKALGIKTFQRKKVDVLAEIAEKTKNKEQSSVESSD